MPLPGTAIAVAYSVARRAIRYFPPVKRGHASVRQAWNQSSGLRRLGAFSGAAGLGSLVLVERAPNSGRFRMRNLLGHDFVIHWGQLAHDVTFDGNEHLKIGRDDERFVRVQNIFERLVSCAARAGIDPIAPDNGYGNGGTFFSAWKRGSCWKWNLTLTLVDSDMVQAEAYPGGPIVVYGGLLNCTDTEIAAVLSHELAHVYQGHFAEKISRQILFFFVMNLLLLSVLWDGADSFASFLQTKFQLDVASVFVDYLHDLPFSRVCEAEADKVGVDIMLAACEHPAGMIAFFTRLRQMEGEDDAGEVPPSNNDNTDDDGEVTDAEAAARRVFTIIDRYSSTHPTHTARVNAVSAMMDDSSVEARWAACATR